MHRFTISIYETVLQFNDNLMTQFNEGKGYEGIRTIKISKFENAKNEVLITEKKGKQYVRQIIYTNQEYLPTKVDPVINYTDELVIEWDVLVVESTFVDDCK